MKRTALIIIICLVAIVCQAQEHLRFLDIPLGGEIEKFAEKLIKEKGFEIVDSCDYEDPNFKMDVRLLRGSFETFSDCNVLLRQIEGTNGVSSVVVIADTAVYVNGELDKLVALYDKKFGEHSTYWGNKRWERENGRILAGIQEDVYAIVYMDKPEVEIRDVFVDGKMKELTDSLANYFMEIKKEQETIKEICGIPFGSSYEKTKEILNNKYGYPEYNPDRTVITYKRKTYAGIMFDAIHFLFQSDGIHSYLNGCVFILDAKSLSDAKKKQEILHKKLSEKYLMIDDTDSNGNKYYVGGYPPTQENGVGFCIDILKYDSELTSLYNHTPYAARLAYGRYNYVKEEF